MEKLLNYEGLGKFKEMIDGKLETKAEIDGYYEEMTVGDAEQLVATQYVEDSVPYKYRTTGGSADVGNREYVDAIVGGTIAWNQLVQNGNFADSSGWVTNGCTLSASGNVGTFTLSSDASSYASVSASTTTNNYVQGHKYLFSFERTATHGGDFRYWIANATSTMSAISTSNAWVKIARITQAQDSVSSRLTIALGTNYSDYKANDTIKIRNVVIFDLTQMFGSTIADYIYSLEQATAGAGVAFFRKLFPKDYYEYNAGELLSVSGVSAHETVGFNQWDEEWEVGGIATLTGVPYASTTSIRSKNYIPVMPNTVYYIAQPSRVTGIYLYDADKNFILYDLPGLSVFTTPSNARYLRLGFQGTYGTTYNHDICINLSWSGTRNGEYEQYEKHSYPLDSSLELRGIPKLSASNELYYDGDEYSYDGKVTRRYGVKTLNGTETWHAPDSSGYCWSQDDSVMRSNKTGLYYTQMMFSTVKVANNSYGIGTVTEPVVTAWGGSTATNDNYWYFAAPNVENTSTTAIKEYLAAHPVTVVYMLATPTTEEADPYQQVQICDDFGTEEYVSTSIVPVGHQTRYPANLRDKLQHLPNLASADGTYAVQQVGSQMSLVPIPSAVSDLPDAPTSDGTYTLKATVSNGTATYAWEAETS